MNGISAEYPTPPSANPTKYCRFCFSQFQIKPLFANSPDQNRSLLARIESLIQIRLDPDRDGTSATCHMCLQKLIEMELFRDRCQKLHEAIRRCRPFPTLELQLEELHSYNQNEYSNLCLSIEPLPLDDYELSQEEDNCEPEEETGLNKTFKDLKSTELSVVVDRSDVWRNNRFWQVLARDVGSIPMHVRHALELTGRCREASLGFISPSTINRIEEGMRQSAQKLVDQEQLNGTDPKRAMVKYYGETYWNRPEQFCFNMEERNTILSIASAIQQKGIRYYLKAAKVEIKQIREKVENASELAEILINKIRKYYQSRDFKHLPSTHQCRVYRAPSGAVHAAVRCLICKKDIKATLNDNRWCFQNYVRHCEKKHNQVEEEPAGGGRRRRSSIFKADCSTPKSAPSRTTRRLRSRSRGLSIAGDGEDD